MENKPQGAKYPYYVYTGHEIKVPRGRYKLDFSVWIPYGQPNISSVFAYHITSWQLTGFNLKTQFSRNDKMPGDYDPTLESPFYVLSERFILI